MKRAASILFIALLFLALVLTGCSVKQQTVSPPAIHSSQASADGNDFNSGVIGPDLVGGFYVTSHFLFRYDSLLETYGKRLSPMVAKGDREGVSEVAGQFEATRTGPQHKWRVTAEVMQRFRTLNLWRKADQ